MPRSERDVLGPNRALVLTDDVCLENFLAWRETLEEPVSPERIGDLWGAACQLPESFGYFSKQYVLSQRRAIQDARSALRQLIDDYLSTLGCKKEG